MNPEQILEQVARLLERPPRGRPRKPEPPVPMWKLHYIYFDAPCRPRLTGQAFHVWCFLLHRADPLSRMANVSYREIRIFTGIHSNRSLRRVLKELTHFGYIIPSPLPTGPGLPKNYKIPDYIRDDRFDHPDVLRLAAEADQPRRPKHKPALRLTEAKLQPAEPRRPAAPPPWERNAEVPGQNARVESPQLPPADPTAPPKPTPPHHPPMPDLELPPLDLKNLQALNLDERIEQLGQEVDQLLKALPTKAAGPDQCR
jgi:hypothetical protein